MKMLVLATAAAALLSTGAVPTAVQAKAGCPKWACGSNGTELNGLGRNGIRVNGWRTNGYDRQGIRMNDIGQRNDSELPVVNAVILSSGEIIDLR
jgi:hypothetical protein